MSDGINDGHSGDVRNVRTQAPASVDAELLDAAHQAYLNAYGETLKTFGERHLRAMAAALRVAADAMLGPVMPREWREASPRIEHSLDRDQIDGMLAARRARLLSPADSVTIQERVERILTKRFKTTGVVDAAREIIATLEQEGKQ